MNSIFVVTWEFRIHLPGTVQLEMTIYSHNTQRSGDQELEGVYKVDNYEYQQFSQYH